MRALRKIELQAATLRLGAPQYAEWSG